MNKKKIVVLAGGISTERDVSLSSGKMIYQALKKNGHQAILIDVYLGYAGEDLEHAFEKEEDWAREIDGVKAENPDISRIKALRPDGDKEFFGPGVIALCKAADIVFLALHGESGENGKIQACFDLMGITYTGADYLSSAICMDKGITKELLSCHGVRTPGGIRLKKKEELTEEKRKRVEYPCVVKACCGGSSVGVNIVNGPEGFCEACEDAFLYDEEVVVERYIKGREFSVGVIDGRALPVIEIAPITGFYDYKNKYQAGSTVETCPAELPEERAKELQRLAEDAFHILRLKNYARIDFMMDEDGKFYCLEANTLPGMTPTSLLPQEAAAEGMSFEELCEKIMESAMKVRAGMKE